MFNFIFISFLFFYQLFAENQDNNLCKQEQNFCLNHCQKENDDKNYEECTKNILKNFSNKLHPFMKNSFIHNYIKNNIKNESDSLQANQVIYQKIQFETKSICNTLISQEFLDYILEKEQTKLYTLIKQMCNNEDTITHILLLKKITKSLQDSPFSDFYYNMNKIIEIIDYLPTFISLCKEFKKITQFQPILPSNLQFKPFGEPFYIERVRLTFKNLKNISFSEIAECAWIYCHKVTETELLVLKNLIKNLGKIKNIKTTNNIINYSIDLKQITDQIIPLFTTSENNTTQLSRELYSLIDYLELLSWQMEIFPLIKELKHLFSIKDLAKNFSEAPSMQIILDESFNNINKCLVNFNSLSYLLTNLEKKEFQQLKSKLINICNQHDLFLNTRNEDEALKSQVLFQLLQDLKSYVPASPLLLSILDTISSLETIKLQYHP